MVLSIRPVRNATLRSFRTGLDARGAPLTSVQRIARRFVIARRERNLLRNRRWAEHV
jgi:hypothetical protein